MTLTTILVTSALTASAGIDVIATRSMMPQVACGTLDRLTFHSIFIDQPDVALVNANFDALAAACSMTRISNMDPLQMSFFLGSLARNTNSLTSHDTFVVSSAEDKPLFFDQYYPRGSLMMFGKENYEIVQSYTAKLGSTFDIVSRPELVGSNLVLSYLSGITMMITEPENITESCMTWTSQGKFGTCIAFLNQFECANVDEQTARLEHVQRVASVLGATLTDEQLVASLCKFQRLPALVNNGTESCATNASIGSPQSTYPDYTAMVSNWTATLENNSYYGSSGAPMSSSSPATMAPLSSADILMPLVNDNTSLPVLNDATGAAQTLLDRFVPDAVDALQSASPSIDASLIDQALSALSDPLSTPMPTSTDAPLPTTTSAPAETNAPDSSSPAASISEDLTNSTTLAEFNLPNLSNDLARINADLESSSIILSPSLLTLFALILTFVMIH